MPKMNYQEWLPPFPEDSQEPADVQRRTFQALKFGMVNADNLVYDWSTRTYYDIYGREVPAELVF
jgi:hypothetical protein